MNTTVLTTILKKSNHLILSEDFCLKHRMGHAFTRSRKLSFQNLIYFILHSTHKSLSINYSDFMDSFQTTIPPFVTKQALSKARQGISYEAFLELFHLSVEQFYALSPDLHTRNAFHIYAIDGILNQRKTITYLVEIQTKRESYPHLPLYLLFMMF